MYYCNLLKRKPKIIGMLFDEFVNLKLKENQP